MNATSFPDAAKDEYLTDRIHRAAEIIWLAVCLETGRENDDLVPDGWFEQTETRLARVLCGDEFHADPDGVPFWVYWRALEILNVQRAYASSSRSVEQG